MDPDRLLELLREVATGRRSAEDAARTLETLPFAEVSEAVATLGGAGASGAPTTQKGAPRVHARVDHHRAVRTGFPEVVFCQGKTPEQVAAITAEILAHGDVLLATRALPEQFGAVRAVAEDAVWHEAAHLIVVDRRATRPSDGHVVVATGGTADIPVAEEAATCAEVMGCRVTRLFDVGVAGLHRLLAHTDTLRSAHVIVAVAGMEGALPSLVAGLVDVSSRCPRAWATARTSAESPRCSRCSTPAPAASAWSTSTTASARPCSLRASTAHQRVSQERTSLRARARRLPR